MTPYFSCNVFSVSDWRAEPWSRCQYWTTAEQQVWSHWPETFPPRAGNRTSVPAQHGTLNWHCLNSPPLKWVHIPLPRRSAASGSNLSVVSPPTSLLAESRAGEHLGRHGRALRCPAGADPGPGWQHGGTAGWAPSWYGAPEQRIQDPHGYQDSTGARDRYLSTTPGRPGVPVSNSASRGQPFCLPS